jgi:hypothetical protein
VICRKNPLHKNKVGIIQGQDTATVSTIYISPSVSQTDARSALTNHYTKTEWNEQTQKQGEQINRQQQYSTEASGGDIERTSPPRVGADLSRRPRQPQRQRSTRQRGRRWTRRSAEEGRPGPRPACWRTSPVPAPAETAPSYPARGPQRWASYPARASGPQSAEASPEAASAGPPVLARAGEAEAAAGAAHGAPALGRRPEPVPRRQRRGRPWPRPRPRGGGAPWSVVVVGGGRACALGFSLLEVVGVRMRCVEVCEGDIKREGCREEILNSRGLELRRGLTINDFVAKVGIPKFLFLFPRVFRIKC